MTYEVKMKRQNDEIIILILLKKLKKEGTKNWKIVVNPIIITFD
jgi:hypothetical protein